MWEKARFSPFINGFPFFTCGAKHQQFQAIEKRQIHKAPLINCSTKHKVNRFLTGSLGDCLHVLTRWGRWTQPARLSSHLSPCLFMFSFFPPTTTLPMAPSRWTPHARASTHFPPCHFMVSFFPPTTTSPVAPSLSRPLHTP